MFRMKNESGRSMVEMLGVLAIIGVLSIGGIAGYTLSMRRYRANQVLDAINKYAVIVYNSCQKAIIDGEITDISACTGGGSAQFPFLEDGDLGTIADLAGVNSVKLEQKSTVDVVKVDALFPDVEVCKAVKSIIGSKDADACEYEGVGRYRLWVSIKQN